MQSDLQSGVVFLADGVQGLCICLDDMGGEGAERSRVQNYDGIWLIRCDNITVGNTSSKKPQLTIYKLTTVDAVDTALPAITPHPLNPGRRLALRPPLAYPVNVVLEIVARPQVSRPGVSLKQLDASGPSTQPTQLAALLRVGHLLVRDGAEELAHPETARVATSAARGEDVVSADALRRWSVNHVGHSPHMPWNIDRESGIYVTLSPYDTHVIGPRKSAP